MNTVLEIYDERRPGAERQLRHRLELPVERITARDLIRCRIEADVAINNGGARARLDEKNAGWDQWLVGPGSVERALNGPRGTYGPGRGHEAIASEPLVAVAI